MIVKAEEKDAPVVAALAAALWPQHSPQEMEQDFALLLGDREAAVFLKVEGGLRSGLCPVPAPA